MTHEDKITAFGAYVKGVLDSANSRGVLSLAAQRTMMNGLIALYGGGFELEQPKPEPPKPANPQPNESN